MSELHPFLFDGVPVRGMVVRMTQCWQEILSRRASNTSTGTWPPPVRALLGEMVAAGALMHANIKFNGALVLQIFGDGPVKLAVAEVQPDLNLRATAKVVGDVGVNARLPDLVNLHHQGRCAITLDPQQRLPGQQAYQGVVPLVGNQLQQFDRLSEVLEHYMAQSEQLHTRLVLAADDRVAAGLLIQRLPLQGGATLEDASDAHEDFKRIARTELLTLDVDTLLHRLFWEEKHTRFEPRTPRFACTCNRERVCRMILGLGMTEAQSILDERDEIEVGCDFCGQPYRFDAVDVARLFAPPGNQPPATQALQ
jgi:molecular chaperone Hsp33